MRPKLATLPAVRPNAGIRAAYQRRLDRLIGQMSRSVAYWLKAQYRAKPPELASDASPAVELQKTMGRLSRQWQDKFDDLAPEMAEHFAKASADRVDGALKASLKKAGFAVEFKMTAAQNDVLQATIAENVALIKSIASEYLSEVEGLVMRSVSAGRDLGPLTDALEQRYGITRRRAARIALDQNNKASASLTRARYLDAGITQAIWVHSAGGKTPRPSHVKAGRERTVYDVKTGWFDPDERAFILPGQLISCRCVARAILPGLPKR